MVEIEIEIGFNEELNEKEKQEIGIKIRKILEILGMKIDSMEWGKNE